jgi:hypothetical protein
MLQTLVQMAQLGAANELELAAAAAAALMMLSHQSDSG